MLRFRGFKASINFKSGKTSGIEHYDNSPGISLNGAYRANRDELFGSDLYLETPKKITPAMVKLPTNQSAQSINQWKSTNNLTKPSNETTNTRKSAPDIPQAVNQPTKINVKEQKKLEKQRLVEQKKQEKIAEKERQREEKLRKEREKLIVQQSKAAQQRSKKEEQKNPKKRAAPQPQQTQQTTPSISRQRQQNSTNTLESSISKSSGPPPYSSVPEVTPNPTDGAGNTGFAKPVEDVDSWGLISQHRQQMNRQADVGKSVPKQKHLDLHYNGASMSNDKENSDV
ncbi:glutamic acid-rich protein-like [Maniola hyperantus]|uniref:glutamic acid-rich protein-like n=1 Tax=Aphantopus hyperantus TaxID=2795564 RepID=UPI00156A51D5|nr:SMY2 homolog 2-like [Maniola hyperantus]